MNTNKQIQSVGSLFISQFIILGHQLLKDLVEPMGYEQMNCYYCEDKVYIDSNNEDLDGKQSYFGDDRLGHDILTCPNHSHNGYIS